MTIDERLERLTGRHEALTQTVELLARMQADHETEYRATMAKNQVIMANLMETVGTLAHIAELHDRRLTHVEQRVG